MTGKKVLICIGVFGALVVAALYLGFRPDNLVALAIGGALSTWRHRTRRARDSAFWGIVWQLRQAGIEDRARMLAALEPAKLRDKVRAVLARDGSNESVGDVEQFPFPLGLRRLATRAYWFTWALGLAMLATAALVDAPTWLRFFPLVVAAGCAYGAWSASQRERAYDSVIEVTPFRVSELFPDGRARTILFSWYLELHHEPKLKRLWLTPGSDDPGIVLDYRRMGFDRLVDLVFQYGAFRTDSAGSPPN